MKKLITFLISILIAGPAMAATLSFTIDHSEVSAILQDACYAIGFVGTDQECGQAIRRRIRDRVRELAFEGRRLRAAKAEETTIMTNLESKVS